MPLSCTPLCVCVIAWTLPRCSSLHVDYREVSGTPLWLPSSTSALKLNTALDDFQIRHMTNHAIWRVQQKFGPVSVPEAFGFASRFLFHGKGQRGRKWRHWVLFSFTPARRMHVFCHGEQWLNVTKYIHAAIVIFQVRILYVKHVISP